jgi:hypothetical protein
MPSAGKSARLDQPVMSVDKPLDENLVERL